MSIPTEPIGSLPRSPKLQEAMQGFAGGTVSSETLDEVFDDAVSDTIKRFEATGSPVISDGEQTKPSFATYPLAGLTSLDPEGVVIPFEDGHTRQLPKLTVGPFEYGVFAGSYLPRAKKFASKPLKQAVISASAMSLLYPGEEISDYPREQFIADLVKQSVADIRSCFDNGAEAVQIDFTEARLSLKLDPSKGLLEQFVDLNNKVLSHFSVEEKNKIGVHTCPGGDRDSTHSADIDYRELIPILMKMDVGAFYFQMASEADPDRALEQIGENLKPGQKAFIGVINVIDEDVETAEIVRERVLNAARFIPKDQLGTTDDCGYSPFGDDIATSRDIAFAKIKARVEGTRLAAQELGM